VATALLGGQRRGTGMAGMAAARPIFLQTWHGSEVSKKKQHGDMLYTCIQGPTEYQPWMTSGLQRHR